MNLSEQERWDFNERHYPEYNACKPGVANKAREFAIAHHKNLYAGQPYVVHLDHELRLIGEFKTDHLASALIAKES